MRLKANVFAGSTLLIFLAQPGATLQQPTSIPPGDWPMYRHDYAGTGYSPLSQVNTRNVTNLSQAWTLSLQSGTPATPAAGGRGGGGGVPFARRG